MVLFSSLPWKAGTRCDLWEQAPLLQGGGTRHNWKWSECHSPFPPCGGRTLCRPHTCSCASVSPFAYDSNTCREQWGQGTSCPSRIPHRIWEGISPTTYLFPAMWSLTLYSVLLIFLQILSLLKVNIKGWYKLSCYLLSFPVGYRLSIMPNHVSYCLIFKGSGTYMDP